MCQRTNAALQKYLLAVKCNGVCVTLVTHVTAKCVHVAGKH